MKRQEDSEATRSGQMAGDQTTSGLVSARRNHFDKTAKRSDSAVPPDPGWQAIRRDNGRGVASEGNAKQHTSGVVVHQSGKVVTTADANKVGLPAKSDVTEPSQAGTVSSILSSVNGGGNVVLSEIAGPRAATEEVSEKLSRPPSGNSSVSSVSDSAESKSMGIRTHTPSASAHADHGNDNALPPFSAPPSATSYDHVCSSSKSSRETENSRVIDEMFPSVTLLPHSCDVDSSTDGQTNRDPGTSVHRTCHASNKSPSPIDPAGTDDRDGNLSDSQQKRGKCSIGNIGATTALINESDQPRYGGGRGSCGHHADRHALTASTDQGESNTANATRTVTTADNESDSLPDSSGADVSKSTSAVSGNVRVFHETETIIDSSYTGAILKDIKNGKDSQSSASARNKSAARSKAVVAGRETLSCKILPKLTQDPLSSAVNERGYLTMTSPSGEFPQSLSHDSGIGSPTDSRVGGISPGVDAGTSGRLTAWGPRKGTIPETTSSFYPRAVGQNVEILPIHRSGNPDSSSHDENQQLRELTTSANTSALTAGGRGTSGRASETTSDTSWQECPPLPLAPHLTDAPCSNDNSSGNAPLFTPDKNDKLSEPQVSGKKYTQVPMSAEDVVDPSQKSSEVLTEKTSPYIGQEEILRQRGPNDVTGSMSGRVATLSGESESGTYTSPPLSHGAPATLSTPAACRSEDVGDALATARSLDDQEAVKGPHSTSPYHQGNRGDNKPDAARPETGLVALVYRSQVKFETTAGVPPESTNRDGKLSTTDASPCGRSGVVSETEEPPGQAKKKKPTFKELDLHGVLSLDSPTTGRQIKGILKTRSNASPELSGGVRHVDAVVTDVNNPNPNSSSNITTSSRTKNTFSYNNAAFEGEIITEPSKRSSLANVVSHIMKQNSIIDLEGDNSHPYGRDSSLTDLMTGKRRDTYSMDAGKMIVWLALAIMIVSLAGGIIFMSETYNLNRREATSTPGQTTYPPNCR